MNNQSFVDWKHTKRGEHGRLLLEEVKIVNNDEPGPSNEGDVGSLLLSRNTFTHRMLD